MWRFATFITVFGYRNICLNRRIIVVIIAQVSSFGCGTNVRLHSLKNYHNFRIMNTKTRLYQQAV